LRRFGFSGFMVVMSRKAKPPLDERSIRGLKYLRRFEAVLETLSHQPAHGNRQFHLHHWVGLLLLHFFNPVLDGLRALQEATGLANVQEVLGVSKTSLGAMSEAAAKAFDPVVLEPLLEELSQQLQALPKDARLAGLPGIPTAVDGTFLRCLPKMCWAVFRKKSDKRGVKLHLHFDVQRGIPNAAEVTRACQSEKRSLRKLLTAGKLYLTDRGYIDYALYQAIHDAQSFFVSRQKDNASYVVVSDRPLSQADQQAGVLTDQGVRMGSSFTDGKLTAPVRRLVIRDPKRPNETIILLTNTDLSGELISLLYRYRWQVELFFRWFKCILGCRHWVSQTESGVTFQIYMALLASMLVSLWTGRKPTKSTFRMICLHIQGWARDEELAAHLASLKQNG
jgi:hypothetical protein